KMSFIYMIISTLATTALAKGAKECNFTKPTEAQECSGALGKPLIFYMPMSTNVQIILKKNTDEILKVVNNTVIKSKDRERSVVFSNGTFKLDKVTKRDAGDYLLETYSLTDGLSLHKINIHLEIQ
ncbi:uncharacterized protein AKAME5_000098600, partial [Lates japonicus]